MREFENSSGSHQEKSSNQESERPPENVRLGLIFRKHAIHKPEDVPIVEADLVEKFRQIFRPGEKNIFLMERSGGDETFKKDIEEGYERYHSYIKARVFANRKHRGESTREDFDFTEEIGEKMDILHTVKTGEPQQNYGWIYDKVLDGLQDEGYEITKVFEKKGELVSELLDTENIVKFRDSIHKQKDAGEKRDKKIAKQITALVEDAEVQPGRTNVVALFGSFHQLLVDELPERFSPITSTFAEQLNNMPESKDAELRLRLGHKITDSEWLDLYHGSGPSRLKMFDRWRLKIKRRK
jgi:hypothetical protein